MSIGDFESEYLNEIRRSFSKKQKSLRNLVESISVDRVLIESDTGSREQLRERLDVRVLKRRKITLSMAFYSDRWCWLNSRETVRRKIVFEWERQGRLNETGRELMQAVYASILAIGSDDLQERRNELDSAWVQVLHYGPTIARQK